MLTPKQEKFCLEYLKTGNASEAYRRAYDASKTKPESVNRLAKAMLDNIKITSRLAELKAPVIKDAQITLEGHLLELATIRDAAFKDKEYAAAITAETNRGKAAGLYTTKVEADVNGSLSINIIDKYEIPNE